MLKQYVLNCGKNAEFNSAALRLLAMRIENLNRSTYGSAASRGRTESVKSMIAEGANVNGKNRYGHTRLYWAAFLGRKETARFLIGARADAQCGGQ